MIGRLSARGCLVRGKAIGVERLSGSVLVSSGATGASASVRGLKGQSFVPELRARQVPVGSFVDVRRGRVSLSSGRDANGSKVQSGVFAGGVFQVLQSRQARLRGLTTLRLTGGSFKRTCGTSPRSARRANAGPAAHSALSRRVVRRVRGNVHGNYRVRSAYSAATVRGTAWSVTDRCDGTLTKVTRGTVVVRDFGRKKDIVVRAGKSYLARAP
jgi:hypothetical protein